MPLIIAARVQRPVVKGVPGIRGESAGAGARYTWRMPLRTSRQRRSTSPPIQSALAADGIDGWLLYDFRRHSTRSRPTSPPSARQGGHLATRRWFYLIPATGEPRGLVHAIERDSLAHLPGTTERYAGREQLEAGLAAPAVAGCSASRWSTRRTARSRTSRASTPGTIELVRQSGVEVVSSGDLVQRFAAVWNDEAIETHREASEKLYRDQGSRVRRDRAHGSRDGRADHGVRHPAADGRLVRATKGSSAIRAPNVSAAENAGNPHYLPTATRPSARSAPDELVLLDLWGKLDRPGAVFADITWVGYHRPRGARPATCRRSTRSRAARDAAVALVQRAVARRAGAARLAGRPRRLVGPAKRGLRRPDPPPDRPQPGRDRCTATASTWTTTRRTTTGGCCPAPALRLSRACTSTTSAFASEINMIVQRARRGGHRAAADRNSSHSR